MTDAPLDLRDEGHAIRRNTADPLLCVPSAGGWSHTWDCDLVHDALVRVHAHGWRGGTEAQQEADRERPSTGIDDFVAPLVPPPEPAVTDEEALTAIVEGGLKYAEQHGMTCACQCGHVEGCPNKRPPPEEP